MLSRRVGAAVGHSRTARAGRRTGPGPARGTASPRPSPSHGSRRWHGCRRPSGPVGVAEDHARGGAAGPRRCSRVGPAGVSSRRPVEVGTMGTAVAVHLPVVLVHDPGADEPRSPRHEPTLTSVTTCCGSTGTPQTGGTTSSDSHGDSERASIHAHGRAVAGGPQRRRERPSAWSVCARCSASPSTTRSSRAVAAQASSVSSTLATRSPRPRAGDRPGWPLTSTRAARHGSARLAMETNTGSRAGNGGSQSPCSTAPVR